MIENKFLGIQQRPKDVLEHRFWFGAVGPRPGELEAAYALLGKTATEIFPLRYRTRIPVGGRRLEGEIRAFTRFRSFDDRTIVELT